MTKIRSLNEKYFEWLCHQVSINNGRLTDKTYTNLFLLLYAKEFVWVIPNDDNRVEDGMGLRQEFLGRMRDTLPQGCSVLEVLIALSRSMAFATNTEPTKWAWQLIKNLELHKMHDPLSVRKAEKVGDILEALIWRNYGEDGAGGFFPLAWPQEDQRKVELWYQMNAYIEEQHDP